MKSSARRDLGFERIGKTTRFLAVGALVASGVLTAAVAKALPGKTSHPAAPPTTVGPDSGAASGSAAQNPATTAPALTAPVQAPQPVVTPPVASSGGS